MASSPELLPLYNAVYTLHRLSPLHYSPTLSPSSKQNLDVYARRFSERLRGDTLRGVHVGTDGKSHSVAKNGALRRCQWKLLELGEHWDVQECGDSEEGRLGPRTSRRAEGICITVEYEKNEHTALLLRNPQGNAVPSEGQTHLPLLLTRMPNPVREVLLDFLAKTFDTRIEPMQLSKNFIEEALEAHLDAFSKNGREVTENATKDLVLTFGFNLPIAPSLRALDVTIKEEDLWNFLDRGTKITDSRIGNSREPGKSSTKWKKGQNGDSEPFMAALALYINKHLAMDIRHDDILISKVACARFILNKDGKIKIIAPARAADNSGESENSTLWATRTATSLLMERLFTVAEGNWKSLLAGDEINET
ncbi:hypothetical protein MMC20_001733 [Loxospora ochrophaea]|nr:hypothetical protein [Loxospora ochrophaea]